MSRLSSPTRASFVVALASIAAAACSSASPTLGGNVTGGSGSAASSGAGGSGTVVGGSGGSTGSGQGGSGTSPASGSAMSGSDGGASSGSGGGAGSSLDGGADARPGGPPDFGPNVFVFDPSMPMATIQAKIDMLFTQQGTNQFGPERYALMFKPGSYSLDIKLGYSTQVVGLGQSPDDVIITGALRVNNKPGTVPARATGNFWRACENVSIIPTGGSNTWAVSQGAWLRRVHVRGSLALSDQGGAASGGFLADSKIDGVVSSGSQQQWFSRNAEWASWSGGVWNMVFTGVSAPPAGAWPAQPMTVVAQTPVVREKPFLTVDSAGQYSAVLPALRQNSQGTDWSAGAFVGTSVSVDQFYVARAATDTSATMNAALGSGKSLLLTPGVYMLDASLQVTQPDTVVLGLGLPTLVSKTGTPAMVVADVNGAKLGGFILDAGLVSAPTVLQVGDASSTQGHATDPTSLHDISCRVGGPLTSDLASSCVTINSSDVVTDNLWLWRADHDASAAMSVMWTHPSKNGLIVNGNNVTAYGLFVEHFQEYQTLWNGNGGRVYFYQSEMPYDPPSQTAWSHGTTNGYASYKVAATVTTHEAWGVGVYADFRYAPIIADSAIEAPTAPGVLFHHTTTVWLNGFAGSAISHVVNATGGAVNSSTHVVQTN